MDYLKELFHEELATEGNLYVDKGRLYIREKHWAPEEVLQQISEEAYKDVFDGWLDERKENLIQTADEILAKYEQEDRFAALQQAYGRRGVVTPFIGAGASNPSGYPMWTSFLRRLRRQSTVEEAEFESLLVDGKYEEAAQLVVDNLGVAFNEELEIAYGVSRGLEGVVRYFPYVFYTPVVTTNFDDVLKRSYENAGLPFEEVVAGHLAEELPRYLGAGRRVLIKLHGTALTGKGRVLTFNEYEKHYQHTEILRHLIESLCNRTLLFIGCSLNTDRTLQVMNEISHAKGHDNTSRHYAFLACPETEEERIRKKQQLANCNIYPIWYSPDEHDESIEALLVKMKGEVE